MTTLKEEQKRTVRKYLKVIASGDLDIINEICTEEVTSCTPLGESQGHEALKEYEIPVHEAFSDFEVTFENLVAKNDCIAMRLVPGYTRSQNYGTA